MRAYREISACRACGSSRLIPVLDLGRMALTGVFPRTRSERVTAGPLELVKCDESAPNACGLLQLKQSFDKSEMYGPGYGYHSSLNRTMVAHLERLVRSLRRRVPLTPGDVVVDIGSNDGTLLRAYPEAGLSLVGVDPTAGPFERSYPRGAKLLAEFFSAAGVLDATNGRRAKVVTSIAMFYDLDSPLDFMREVGSVLADDGIWISEQSHLPTMLTLTAYDTVCHEHLEYYGLRQIRWMAERTGLKIVDVETNDVNGGSLRVAFAKAGSPQREDAAGIDRLLAAERRLSGLGPYREFARRVSRRRSQLRAFIAKAARAGRVVAGYGASTKGNVVLQYCGLGPRDISCIGEVNPDKFGCVTPGSRIPIVSETEVRALRPDFLVVFPWHFRDFIVRKEAAYLRSGGRLVFPLPEISIVTRSGA